MRRKLLTILTAFLCVGTFVDGSRLYSVRERLSSSSISCIIQDDYGYLWVATENGLNKFDGYRFTDYLSDAKDVQTLNDNEVTTLLTDKERRLWVGSNKGLSRYVYEENAFRRYMFPNGIRPRVETIVQDDDGNVIIGTSGYGMYAICHGSDTIVHLPSFSRQRDDEFVSGSYIDRSHHLWRFRYNATVSRITFTCKDNGRPSPTAIKNLNSPYGLVVNMMAVGKHSYLLICMHGILRYDETTGELGDAGYDLSMLDADVSIHKALLDHAGNLYIGTLGKGLMVIPRGQKTMVPYEASGLPFDLSTANVNDIFEDRNHNLWVGCYKKGLLQLDRGKRPYQLSSLSEQGYKIGSGVSSVTSDDDCSIWCTVQKSGVYHIGADGKVLSRQSAPDGANIVYRDQRGGYWLGTGTAFYSYHPSTGTAERVLALDGWGVNSITDDGDGTVFISNFSKGLVVYDTQRHETQTYSMHKKDKRKGSLCNDWIKSLTVDSRGLLWIGTTDGVSCLNPDDGNFRVFGWHCLLEGIQCLTICEQRNGDMLLGTNSGLYVFRRKQNKLEQYPQTENLRNKPIFNIVLDKKGELWLTTVDGIWHRDKKTGDFIGSTAGNGLIRAEFTPNASFLSTDGNMVIGCTEGLVTFSPSGVLHMPIRAGKVYVTGLSVGGKAVNPMRDNYEVAWAENSLIMEFSLLDFRNPETVTFQYRLHDDEDWVSLPEGNNTLSLMRLKPGKYNIQVRSMADGIYSADITTVRVTINAPWYASTLAYIIYGLLAIALLALAFYLADRHRQRQLEEEKMRFLLNLKKDVKSALKPVNVKGNNKALLERIMKSINGNLNNPDFNVEQLAADVGVSRAQLHRKMKEMAGISTGDFIRNLRLDQAATLIKEGQVNITQVAYSVGFNNQSHFSTVFRKHFGMTPSEYAVVHRSENGAAPGEKDIKQEK